PQPAASPAAAAPAEAVAAAAPPSPAASGTEPAPTGEAVAAPLPAPEPVPAPSPAVDGDITAILRLLRGQGFSDFSGITRQGDAFAIDARQGGQAVRVTVDARTGEVLSVE
ncbi:MAG: hypothetical protein IRY94_03120, partial [Rhodospirillaceae bacterium]|nr:hypothetical protein [Rhodospirillaceae bacterium]